MTLTWRIVAGLLDAVPGEGHDRDVTRALDGYREPALVLRAIS
jgi:hypothetical protein